VLLTDLQTPDFDTMQEHRLPPPPRPVSSVRSTDFLEAAKSLGDLLTTHRVEEPDLGHGLAGIVLFQAYLGSVLEDRQFTDEARDGLARLRRILKYRNQPLKSPGGFNGWGGPIYLLSHLAVLWAEPELLNEAETMAMKVFGLLNRDDPLDLHDGTAGFLSALLSLYRCTGSRHTLRQAVKCGDRLLDGITERLRFEGPLTALLPGVQGMAGPLLQLAQASYAERFRSAAETLLSCRRSERLSTDSLTRGRSLLQAVPEVEQVMLKEINALLERVAAAPPCATHSLDGGEMGVVQLFVDAVETYGRQRWRSEAQFRSVRVLQDAKRRGWLCQGSPDGESKGLRHGLAGIGYGLLRVARPQLVPSVLNLAPPLTL
jgi:lantibiotic modifying enzyme